MSASLHVVPRQQLDTEKWDRCVHASPNGLIYSEHTYLDTMAENWMGLVSEDYSIVCALPWKKKFGIRYIYPPPYVQQSGLIGPDVNQSHISEALQLMKSFARYGEYYFNFGNSAGSEAKKNFILSLDKQHDAASYPSDFRYDLKKAAGYKLSYRSSLDHKGCIDLYCRFLQEKKKTSGDLQKRLHALANAYAAKNRLLVREVLDETGNLLSTVLCLEDNRRIYLLLSATTNDGRKMRANHFLMDQLMQELMPAPLLFDFVGSDIDGVAHYYRNFTNEIQPYYRIKWNDLPAPLRWIRK